ncbi:MAG: hypothetical protein V3V22_03820 [Methylococcales bacterium]
MVLITNQIVVSKPIDSSIDTDCKDCLKTAKERLGLKGDDEQRVNDCKVPILKRGLKVRSAQCNHKKPEIEYEK